MTPRAFLDGKVLLYGGDCREAVRELADASIDSVVTDPPYALVSIGKRFGGDNAAPAKAGKTGAYARASAGFMGKKWDTGETAFDLNFWTDILRVLKPGGHLISFSGTRTYHRMACAIEDAGFEIRDQIGWTYGSGFPKSHNVARAIDSSDEEATAWLGWGTALKPAWEPICLGRKPLVSTVAENVLQHGTGALNIGACRVGTEGGTKAINHVKKPDGRLERWDEGSRGARNEISQIDAGRWPANIIHDGSEEVLAAFPERDGAVGMTQHGSGTNSVYGEFERTAQSTGGNGTKDTGSAARFFYSAKADSDDRLGSKHPTVKPVDLMRYLVRLVTPPGGTVLDPFAGTGTTGEAAFYEGFSAVLFEREEEYQADIARRMEACLSGPDERTRIANKNKQASVESMPLFGGTGHAGGGSALSTESSLGTVNRAARTKDLDAAE